MYIFQFLFLFHTLTMFDCINNTWRELLNVDLQTLISQDPHTSKITLCTN